MTSRKRLVFSYCCLALLLAVLFAVSLFWGSVALTPQAVLAALTGRGQDALSVGIITQLRLPRAVMAALLGAALSAAGYLLQTFFANPIAGPFVMGISSGAKLAVALVMVLFLNYGLLTSSAVLILAAFAGAMAAMAFVLAAARRVPVSYTHLKMPTLTTLAATPAMLPRTMPATPMRSAKTSCWSCPSAPPSTTAALPTSRVSRTLCRPLTPTGACAVPLPHRSSSTMCRHAMARRSTICSRHWTALWQTA